MWRVKWGGVPCALRGATPHYKTAPDVIETQLKTHRCASAADMPGAAASAGAVGGAGSASKSASSAAAAAASRSADPSGPSFDFSPPPSFFDDAETVELRPGDRFHFPPGMWHRVECEEDSLSINISLVGQSWGDVMAAATRHLMHRTAAGRGLASAMIAGAAGAAATAAGSGSAAAATGATGSSAASGSLSAMHSHVQGMLSELQASLAQLRPGHLMPPVSMLSRRFSRLHGAGAPAESDGDGASDADEEEDGDGSDGSDAGSDSSSSGSGKGGNAASSGPGDALSAEVLAAHGLGEDGDGPLFRVWLHKGGPVITLGDVDDSNTASTKSAAATGASKAARSKDAKAAASSAAAGTANGLSLSPLAVIIHGDDVVRPKEAAAQAAAAELHATGTGGVGAKRSRALAASASASAPAARSRGASAAITSGKAKAKRARKGGAAASESESASDSDDAADVRDSDSDSDDESGDGDDEAATYLPPSPPRFDSWIVNSNWGDDPETLVSHVRAVLQTPRGMRPAMKDLTRSMTATAPSFTGSHVAFGGSSSGPSAAIIAVPSLPQALERALVFLGVLA